MPDTSIEDTTMRWSCDREAVVETPKSSVDKGTGPLSGFEDMPEMLLQDLLLHLDSLERPAVRRVCRQWNSVLSRPTAYRAMACYIPVEADLTLMKSSKKGRKRTLGDVAPDHSVVLINGRSASQYKRVLTSIARKGKPYVRSLLFYGNFLPQSETKGELWGNQNCSFDGCKIRAQLLKVFSYASDEYCPLGRISFVNCSLFIGELAGRWKTFERIKPTIILQNVALREVVRFFAFYQSFNHFAEIPIVVSGREMLDVAAFLQNQNAIEDGFRQSVDADYFDPEVHRDISETVLHNDKNACMLFWPLLEKYVPKPDVEKIVEWRTTLTGKRISRRVSVAFRDYLKLYGGPSLFPKTCDDILKAE
ncbi:hypothetical protein RvY_11126-2 [Ramazzottius varieornatus]|uniref:F-box domain-containing protein n=1 Tax=Ramazzottius varieornatus TaxID=947166 RepID=A0A1D1VF25_RAMVA|nr:hypothetical protein RvY_11126-2 [Ramazzottius varieornatus]